MENSDSVYIKKDLSFEIDVPKFDFIKISSKLDEINKKYSKKGFDLIIFEVIGSHFREITLTVEDERKGTVNTTTQNIEFYKLKVRGGIPHIPNHSLLFKVELEEETKAPFFSYAKNDLPSDILKMKDIHCSLCGLKRKRKVGHGFINDKTQEIIILGGECAKEFTPKNLEALIEIMAYINPYLIIKDEYSLSMKDGEEEKGVYFVEDALYLFYDMISKNGFIPKNNDKGLGSTFDEALQYLDNNRVFNGEPNKEIVGFYKNWEKDSLVSELNTSETNKVNIRSILKQELVSKKNISTLLLLAILLVKKKDHENESKTPSEFIGNAGDSIEICGEVLTSKTYLSDFGWNNYVTYTLLKTDKGDLVETTSSSFTPNQGERVKIKGKIKKLRRDKSDRKITVINYPVATESEAIEELKDYFREIEKREFSLKSIVVINGEEKEIDDLRPAVTLETEKVVYALTHALYDIQRRIDQTGPTLAFFFNHSAETVDDLEGERETTVTCSRTSFKFNFKTQIINHGAYVKIKFSWKERQKDKRARAS